MTRLPVVRTCGSCSWYVPDEKNAKLGICPECIFVRADAEACQHFNAPTGLRWKLEPGELWSLRGDGLMHEGIIAHDRKGNRELRACKYDIFSETGDIKDLAKSLVARVLAEGGER